MIIKIIVLVALIRLLIATDKPLLCSGLYTFVGFALGLLAVMGGQAPFLALLIATVIRFALSGCFTELEKELCGGSSSSWDSPSDLCEKGIIEPGTARYGVPPLVSAHVGTDDEQETILPKAVGAPGRPHAAAVVPRRSMDLPENRAHRDGLVPAAFGIRRNQDSRRYRDWICPREDRSGNHVVPGVEDNMAVHG